MAMRLVSATLLIGLAAQTAPATPLTAAAFLKSAFKLSASESARLDQGHAIARTLDVENSREVATLGIVRIHTSPARYVERLTDIASFKRTDGVLQVGKFSTPAQLEDVASLSIDAADVKRLRDCQVDDCEVRLSADGIARISHEVDWRAPNASATANRLVRQFLVDYVNEYRQGGLTAKMEYASSKPRLNVGREFAALLQADPVTAAYAPRLRRHLLEYPASSADQTTDFIYWSKELVRGKPVVSVTHVAISAATDDSPVAYAIGSKQIYAMHYYDASLGLTLLVPDRAAKTPTTYVVYLNRSRIDLFDGLFGGFARRIVAGRARSLVAEQLQRLQGVLRADTVDVPASPSSR